MAEIAFIDREKRERAAQELDFIEQLQAIVIDRLRQMQADYAGDQYLNYDLGDAISSLGRDRKELLEMAEGLRGDRYIYGDTEEEAA